MWKGLLDVWQFVWTSSTPGSICSDSSKIVCVAVWAPVVGPPGRCAPGSVRATRAISFRKRAALLRSVYQGALAVWPTQFNHVQHFLEARLKLASLKGRWTVTPIQPMRWRLADWTHFSIRSKSSMMLKSGSVKYTHKGSSVVLDSNTS